MQLVNIANTDQETEEEIFEQLRGKQFVALIIPFRRSEEFYKYLTSASIDREQIVYACKLLINETMANDDEIR